MKILAIETSCDETAAAVVEKTTDGVFVRSNIISSQATLHAAWGGVVPTLAAREHVKNIRPVIQAALREAKVSKKDIHLIAVTHGPGLIPALVVGVMAAKTLSYVWKKPLLGIHHIEGHIYANAISNSQFLISNKTTSSPARREVSSLRDGGVGSSFQFPLLALVVSGGHTQLVLMRKHFDYEILGETQDDAAGEAFDKVAKMLGLGYPGGPVIAARAVNFQFPISNNQISNSKPSPPTPSPDGRGWPKGSGEGAIQLPRPMLHSGDYNFSFSGLKTAVLYALKKNEEKLKDENFVNEVCYEFQEAVMDVLVAKSKKAIQEYQPKTLVIAGGVSANVRLRERLQTMVTEHFPDTRFLTPDFIYSLDNAAMIGAAAAFRWEMMSEKQKNQTREAWRTLDANANLKLQNLE